MPIITRVVTSEEENFSTDHSTSTVNNANESREISNKHSADSPRIESVAGYSHTGAFAGKPLDNNYVWEAGVGINYTQDDVNNDLYKVFSLDRDVHLAVDNPYWSIPNPTGKQDIGLFQGANLPDGVDTLVDYEYDFDANYPASTGTGFEGSIGRIKLNDLQYGDQLRVRFDFNAIPQIANTTLEPAFGTLTGMIMTILHSHSH